MGRRKVEVHAWSTAELAAAEVNHRLGDTATAWARELFWLGLHRDGYSKPRNEFADPILRRRELTAEERLGAVADLVCGVLERVHHVRLTGRDAVLLEVAAGAATVRTEDGFDARRKRWDEALRRARKRERITPSSAVSDLTPEAAVEDLAFLRLQDRPVKRNGSRTVALWFGALNEARQLVREIEALRNAIPGMDPGDRKALRDVSRALARARTTIGRRREGTTEVRSGR